MNVLKRQKERINELTWSGVFDMSILGESSGQSEVLGSGS